MPTATDVYIKLEELDAKYAELLTLKGKLEEIKDALKMSPARIG